MWYEEFAQKGAWKLTVGAHLSDSEDQIGHAFVSLENPDGEISTYGYWPKGGAQNKDFITGVDGVVYDDSEYLNMENGLNASKTFEITEAQYGRAMNEISRVQNTPQTYSLTGRHCGSFATHIANIAGQNTGAGINSPRALYQRFGGEL